MGSKNVGKRGGATAVKHENVQSNERVGVYLSSRFAGLFFCLSACSTLILVYTHAREGTSDQ